MFNFSRIGLAALVVVATMGASFALNEQRLEVDLADQPTKLAVPIGQVTYVELSNTSNETRTFWVQELDRSVTIEPGQTQLLRLRKDELTTKRFLTYRVPEQEWAAEEARQAMLAEAAQAATVVTTGSPVISKYEPPVFEEKAEVPHQGGSSDE